MPTVSEDVFAPLQIANPLLSDPGALRAQAAADGYLFFKGLIDPKELKQVRADILGLLAKRGWLARDRAIEDGIAGETTYVEGIDDEFQRAYREIQKLESFHALAHSAKLVEAFHILFGETVLVHPRNIARVIFPHNTKYTTPPHQDYIHIMGTQDTWTSWFPLMDCPRKLGGLAILPGTHRMGPLPIRAAYGAGGVGIDTDGIGATWRTNEFACGDVVIFHSLTVHRGLDNVDPRNRLRLSVDYRYQAASKPVVFHSLWPHCAEEAYWPEIYRGWTSTEYQYYWKKLPLNVVDEDRSHPNLVRPMDTSKADG